jgi:nitroreductase
MEQLEETVFNTIYARRSIRSYEDREVEQEKIVKLLKAGMAAPSACNMQVWEFVVITDREILGKLSETAQTYNAPAVMAVCSNTKNIPWKNEDWKAECGAAIENMLLAATAMGLSSIWVGMFDKDIARKLLDIPEDINIMNLVCFGYSEKRKSSATKYDESAVFWQKYDPSRERSLRTMQMLGDGYQEDN